MSDHEEHTYDTGYDTPVPELDDHRHQSSSVQRPSRSRRGTVDTLYGASSRNAPDLSQVDRELIRRNLEDFEEVIADEGSRSSSPRRLRSRRPTVDTTDQRGISPPNSVKAFAEARRREREMSLTDQTPLKLLDPRRTEDHELHRTHSGASRRSRRSRPYTNDVAETASFSSNKSAEEDVCFPIDNEHRKDKLYIDFDYLESFIQEENVNRMLNKAQPNQKVFTDMRPQSSSNAPIVMSSSGDVLELPSSEYTEKENYEVEESPRSPQVHPDPNRFSFFSSAWESTIHAAEFGDLVLPGEDLRGLFTFPKDEEADGVWWLNMHNPTEDEIRSICKAFGIHPLTIEDISTQEAREKIELFPSYYFACFRSFNIVESPEGQEYEPFHTYVVVFREGTLSFSFAANSHASHVRKRIAMLKDYVALSSDWICYALIDDIVDSFAPVIHGIEQEADLIEDQVFIARAGDMHEFLRKIGTVRKNVMSLMRLLGGKADVLRGFTKRCNENYKVTPRMDIGLYLGDIQDHVVTMMTNLGHFEKMLSRSHSNYLAQLSIDNITQGNSTNQVLSKITFLASILVPLNLVCGMFGMNVAVPFRDVENLAPFFGILGVLITFVVICLFFARKYKYI